MKTLIVLALLLLTGCSHTRERIVVVGYDTSATAFRTGNPNDAGWAQVLSATQAGDHVYVALINERGLANGCPVIDFTIRPYNFLTDKTRDYDQAVKAKLAMERQALADILKRQAPSQRTEIFGFIFAAVQIFRAYPPNAERKLLVWTDGIQDGESVNLARLPLTDRDIGDIIASETAAGRLPDLHGIAVWFITGPSLQTTQIGSNRLLRLEVFWRRYLKAAGADLRAYSPVLVDFGGDRK
jgi:hypothetical protein